MEVIFDRSRDSRLPGSVVTIGAYDGIHLGHRLIMADLVSKAKELEVPSVVVTFDRHPASVIRPASAPLLLTDLESRLELLAGIGVDYVYLIEFDAVRATETASDFVEQVLVGSLCARRVMVGSDFHFGHNRQGNVAYLADRGAEYGFEVVGQELLRANSVDGISSDLRSEVVSSTLIRRLIAEGRVRDASLLLGRDHCLRGIVAHGDNRGGGVLGFPTANIDPPAHIAVPGDGIYAGHLRVLPDGAPVGAAISVGSRPTYYPDGGPRLVESYLIDFDGDLYGKAVEVTFRSHIRAQAAFDNSESLVRQIERDVEDIRAALG
ncbi:MAG: bifunctional riboflavin kinase/FAD synthetase [Acidimicrobiaceae bacterium]|nr:bifunctional riboflavin kinase/FAD synthetase [Acidimicrobiaceae bacterium]